MTSENAAKVWFVTGSSRGFGRVWAEAARTRGDRVVLTARDAATVADLVDRFADRALALELDVTDRDAVFAAVARAVQHFGRIDVVVGNAGFGLFGAVEELDEAAARRQMEVNFFGNVWLLQAVAPVLRSQGGGHVLLTSSFGGLISFGTAALYGASKFATEALGESFAMEMQDFGVRVTLIEPAAYSTDFAGQSATQAYPIAAYDAARERTGRVFAEMPAGNPRNTSQAVLDVVDSDDPPLRLMLGAHVLEPVLTTYELRMASWRTHAEVADKAQ